MSVPAYKTFELAGSITSALIGMLGIPLPDALQIGAAGEVPEAATRFVIFQRPWPAGA